MTNKRKGIIFVSSAAVAATTVTGLTIGILYDRKQASDQYKTLYNKTLNDIKRVNISDETKRLLFADLSKLPTTYKTPRQFEYLAEINKKITDAAVNSVNNKLNELVNFDSKVTTFTNLDDLITFNDALDKLLEFDKLLPKLNDSKDKDELIAQAAQATKPEQVEPLIDRLKELIDKQAKELAKLKESVDAKIAKLPAVIQDNFLDLRARADDDKEKLRELSTLLDKTQLVADKAKEIQNIYQRDDVYQDMTTLAPGDELPGGQLDTINKKVDEILNSEENRDLEDLRKQVHELNNALDDEAAKKDFSDKIDKAGNIPELVEIQKQIEDKLRAISGVEGLLNSKKKILKDRVNKSNLPEIIKQRYLDDIDNANLLSDLDNIETELKGVLAIEDARNAARAQIEALNNPPRNELLNELNNANTLEDINKVGQKALDLLNVAKKEARTKIRLLDGDYDNKNRLDVALVDAKTQKDVVDLELEAERIFQKIKDNTQDDINKIDPNGEFSQFKKELQSKLTDLNNNPNAIAKDYLDLSKKANTVDNYEEAKKRANEYYNKLDDENKAKITKEYNTINSAQFDPEKLFDPNDKTTNQAFKAVLDAKEKIEDIYNFQENKKIAQDGIDKIENATKKAEFKDRLLKVTNNAELAGLISDIKNYHKLESDNKLTNGQLEYIINKYIKDPKKKAELLNNLKNATSDSNGKTIDNQNTIFDNLSKIRNEITNSIDAQNQLDSQKEQIGALIDRISDPAKKLAFRDKLVDVNDPNAANDLLGSIDNQIKLQNEQSHLSNLADNIIDPKTKQEFLNKINSLPDAAAGAALAEQINKSLADQDAALATAKTAAKDKLGLLSNANPKKLDLYNQLSNAKTPQEIKTISDQVDSYINELKDQAKKAIARTEGGLTEYNGDLKQNLESSFGASQVEAAIQNVIDQANKAFSDVHDKVIDTLDGDGSTANPGLKDTDKKAKYAQDIINSNTIKDLNNVLDKINKSIAYEHAHDAADAQLQNVQDPQKAAELAKELEATKANEDTPGANAILDKINQQIESEHNEIANLVAQTKEQIKKLYKPENIDLFNKRANKPDLGLLDARDMLKTIKNTIALEQDELANKKTQARKDTQARLLAGPKLDEFKEKIQAAQSQVAVDGVIKEVDAYLQSLKDDAKAQALKLNDNEGLIRDIDAAITQAAIAAAKQTAITRLNDAKAQVSNRIDEVINVVAADNKALKDALAAADNQTQINQVNNDIDAKLAAYNADTKADVARLNNPDADHIITSEHWTTQSISKQQRDRVSDKINSRLSEYDATLAKLVGDNTMHKKYADIKAAMDTSKVKEQQILDYISEMNAAFEGQKQNDLGLLSSVTNNEQKSVLNQMVNTAATIQDLNDAKTAIQLQIHKEAVLATLDSKKLFPEQKTSFNVSINGAQSEDALNQVIKDLEVKDVYNRALQPQINAATAANNNIDLDESKATKDEYAQLINDARSNEDVAAVMAKIKAFLDAKKAEAKTQVDKLTGRQSRETEQGNLDSTQSESGYKQIKDAAAKIFSDEQADLKKLLNGYTYTDNNQKVQSVTGVSDQSFKDAALKAIDNAANMGELDAERIKINNQKTREGIQKLIDTIQESTDKAKLQNDLNQAQNAESLQKVETEVNSKLTNQSNQVTALKAQVKEKLNVLNSSNSVRTEIEKTIDNQTQIFKLKEDSQKIDTELKRIRDEVQKEITQKIQPTNRNNENPGHLNKYNELQEQVKNARTDEDLLRIKNTIIPDYLKSVVAQYKSKIDSSLDATDAKEFDTKLQTAEKFVPTAATQGSGGSQGGSTIPGSGSTSSTTPATKDLSTVNQIDDVLKQAQDKLKQNAETLNNKVEDASKKAEFTKELNDAYNQTNTGSVFVNKLEKIKEVYDKIQTQRQLEETNLKNLKAQITNQINASLNDSAKSAKKTELENELKLADTSTKANDVKTKVEKEITDAKTTATAVIEKLKGNNRYDNLKQRLDQSNDLNNINTIQAEANKVLNDYKNEVTAAINQVEDNSTKTTLTSEVNDTSKQTYTELSNIKNKAQIKYKQEQITKEINQLWNKDNYQNQVNATDVTLDKLNNIESQVQAAKRNQDTQLAQAKTEAKQYIDKASKANEYNNELQNATTLDAVKTVKDKAIKDVETAKNAALAELNKLQGSPDYNTYNQLINDTSKTESALNQLKTNVEQKISQARTDAENAINATSASNKAELIKELKDTSKTDTYAKIKSLEYAAKVQEKADPIKTSISSILSRDQSPYTTRLTSITSTHPTSEADMNQKLNELNQLSADVTTKNREQTVAIQSALQAFNQQVDKIDVSTDKKNEFKNQAGSSDPQTIKDAENKVTEYLNSKQQEINNLLNKFIPVNENGANRKQFENDLKGAHKESEYNALKAKIEAKFNDIKANAEVANKIFGNEKNSEFNTAKTTDTEKAYTDFTNKINQEFNNLKNQTKASLDGITNNSEKAKLQQQIDSAPTKAKIEEIKTQIQLQKDKESALNEANKLSDSNVQKQTIINAINNATTSDDVNNQKTAATNALKTIKDKATNDLNKITGDVAHVQAQQNLQNATTEDQIKAVENTIATTLANKKNEVQNEINQLASNPSSLSTTGKDTISDLNNLKKQVIEEAKKQAKTEVDKIATNNSEKTKLESQLNNVASVAQANEIKKQAVAQQNHDQALASAKSNALQIVNKLADTNNKKNELKNAINAATDPSVAQAKGQEAQTILNNLNNEFTKTKNRFDANSTDSVFVTNQHPADNEKAITDATTALKNELAKIKDNASAAVEKLKVNTSATNDSSENNDYNQLKEALNKYITNNQINDQATESDLNNIINQVNQKLNNKKSDVKAQVDALTQSQEKTNLENQLKSTDLTKNTLVDIENKAKRQKQVDDTITYINNKKLNADGVNNQNIIPDTDKNNFINQAKQPNANLDQIKQEVDNKFNEIKNSLKAAKDAAKAAINKLPVSQRNNYSIDSLTKVADVNAKKTQAESALNTIRNDVQTEINKLGSSQKSYLESKKNQENNDGQKLLYLKEEAKRIKTKSDDVSSYIDSQFANNNAQKTYFKDQVNSTNGDNETKLDSLKAKITKVAAKVTDVQNTLNSAGLPHNEVSQFTTELGNAHDESTLDTLKNKILVAKAKNDALNEINKLDNNQKSTLQSELTNNSTQSIDSYNTIKNKAVQLKKDIDAAQSEINKLQSGNQTDLKTKLSNAKDSSTATKIKNDAITLKQQVDAAKSQIDTILNDSKYASKKNDLINNSLYNATDKNSIDSAVNEAKKYKRGEEIKELKDQISGLINRLSDQSKKNDFTNKNNAVNNHDYTNESTYNSDTSTLNNLKAEVSNYLNQKKTEAQNQLNRLSSTGATKVSNYDSLKNLVNSDNTTESQYQKVVTDVNSEINKLKDDALKEINKLPKEIIQSNNLMDGLDATNVTQQTIENKKALAIAQQKNKENIANTIIKRLDGIDEQSKSKLADELSKAKTDTEKQDIIDKAQASYTNTINDIKDALGISEIIQQGSGETKDQTYKNILQIDDAKKKEIEKAISDGDSAKLAEIKKEIDAKKKEIADKAKAEEQKRYNDAVSKSQKAFDNHGLLGSNSGYSNIYTDELKNLAESLNKKRESIIKDNTLSQDEKITKLTDIEKQANAIFMGINDRLSHDLEVIKTKDPSFYNNYKGYIDSFNSIRDIDYSTFRYQAIIKKYNESQFNDQKQQIQNLRNQLKNIIAPLDGDAMYSQLLTQADSTTDNSLVSKFQNIVNDRLEKLRHEALAAVTAKLGDATAANNNNNKRADWNNRINNSSSTNTYKAFKAIMDEIDKYSPNSQTDAYVGEQGDHDANVANGNFFDTKSNPLFGWQQFRLPDNVQKQLSNAIANSTGDAKIAAQKKFLNSLFDYRSFQVFKEYLLNNFFKVNPQPLTADITFDVSKKIKEWAPTQISGLETGDSHIGNYYKELALKWYHYVTRPQPGKETTNQPQVTLFTKEQANFMIGEVMNPRAKKFARNVIVESKRLAFNQKVKYLDLLAKSVSRNDILTVLRKVNADDPTLPTSISPNYSASHYWKYEDTDWIRNNIPGSRLDPAWPQLYSIDTSYGGVYMNFDKIK
ncbi:hypothetical protein ACXYRP_01195 [Mycoplasma sp. 5912]